MFDVVPESPGGRTQTFLFIFGYETPTQHRNNAVHGWDDEDSQAVFIEATTAEEALPWGREVAERFVADLWAKRGESGPSWKEVGYAHWIETDAERIEAARGVNVPVIRVGSYPSW